MRWKLDARKPAACLDDTQQMRKERVIPVCAIEPVISVGPVGEDTNRSQVSQLFLNRAKGEAAHAHQFANVTLLFWISKKQPQDLSANLWK